MGFRRQMHDRVGLVGAEHALDLGAVADIDLLEGIARIARDLRERVGMGGVGQLVEIDHRGVGLAQAPAGSPPIR